MLLVYNVLVFVLLVIDIFTRRRVLSNIYRGKTIKHEEEKKYDFL